MSTLPQICAVVIRHSHDCSDMPQDQRDAWREIAHSAKVNHDRAESRIATLTAELAQARCEHPQQHHGRCLTCGKEPLDTISLAQYEQDLATEKAAREAAERDLSTLRKARNA